MPDQVGDVLRAKHAGSRVVLPTGGAALCHLLQLACAHTEGFELSANRGKAENHPRCQINTGSRGAFLSTKQIGKRWEALGRERRNRRARERLGRELSFSFLTPPFHSSFPSSSNLSGKPGLFTSPLRHEVLKWREAERACSLFRLHCQREHWCLFERVHLFPDKVTYKVTTAVETFKAPFNGQHNKTNPRRFQRGTLGGRKGPDIAVKALLQAQVPFLKHKEGFCATSTKFSNILHFICELWPAFQKQ